MKKIIIYSILSLYCGNSLNAQSNKRYANLNPNISEKEETSKPKRSSNTRISNASIGLIKLSDNFWDLIRKFGDSNIAEEEMEISPENENTEIKTIVNSGEEGELIVSWTQGGFHKKIRKIETGQSDFPYITTEGIKYGTTLEELISINEAPIDFLGFGANSGGLIINFNNGKLEHNYGKRLQFELSIDGIMDENINTIQILKTEDEKIKKYFSKIYISKIILKNEQ